MNGNYSRSLIEKRQLLFHFHHLPACSILSTWDSTEKTLAGKGNQRKVCCKHHVLKISSCFTNSICIIFSCPEGWGEKIKQKKKTSKQRNLLIRIPGAKSWILLWHQSEFQRYIGEAGSKEWEKQCEFWRREVSESKDWDGRKTGGVLFHEGCQLRLGHCRCHRALCRVRGSLHLLLSLLLFPKPP